MKIFLIGLPGSGRSTVAKAIVEANNFHYIDAASWVKSDFRDRKEDEHIHQYEDEYAQYLTNRMLVNPSFVRDHVQEMMKVNTYNLSLKDPVFVIDGILSPQDFVSLFNNKEDIIVFLNRIDNDNEYRDHENIGASVIRDYCFWMSSAGILNKKYWMEYNFRIPGEDSDAVKAMGAQNSVFIVKSIKKVISHLNEQIKMLTKIPQSL